MVRRTMIVGSLVLIVALAACGGDQGNTTSAVGDTGETADADRTTRAGLSDDIEMPLSMKLPVGTLMLEETAYEVTPAQAKELLPLWQMLRALQESGTASQVEIEAVLDQIQEAMTPEQLAAIEEMSLDDMQALFEELGMGRRDDSASDEGERGGLGPPDVGMMPMPEGGGEGMLMGPGAMGDLNAEEQATAMAGRTGAGMGFDLGLTEEVIGLLETRAAEV